MPQEEHEALKAARVTHATEEWQQRYKRRAGIEGTIKGFEHSGYAKLVIEDLPKHISKALRSQRR